MQYTKSTRKSKPTIAICINQTNNCKQKIQFQHKPIKESTKKFLNLKEKQIKQKVLMGKQKRTISSRGLELLKSRNIGNTLTGLDSSIRSSHFAPHSPLNYSPSAPDGSQRPGQRARTIGGPRRGCRRRRRRFQQQSLQFCSGETGRHRH